MSSHITPTQSSNSHPLAHIPGTCDFISYPLQVMNTGPCKSGCIKLNHLHMNNGSPLLPIFFDCCSASTVIPLLSMASFTPSIHPNLQLPHTRPPLTSAIITILAIQYSSIRSTCPNHLNTLNYSLSIPALLHTSSFTSTLSN